MSASDDSPGQRVAIPVPAKMGGLDARKRNPGWLPRVQQPIRRFMVDVGKLFALFALGSMIALPGYSGAQTAPPAAGASSATASDGLQKVISQLNTAATKFESAQADFSWDQYIAAVQEDDVQAGTIYFERKKGVTRMAADLKTLNEKPAPKTVVYDNGQVEYYEPAIKQVTVIRAGANHGQWESFLTLGFGGSGTDLEATWKVSLLATESMNGVTVAKLDLVPRDQKILDLFTHVTIWIDPSRGVSLKQIFYQPTGDLRTATYKNIRYNQPIASDIFQIKPAPGTTRINK
jgi:outer membrane lipoprotein-sorting protein